VSCGALHDGIAGLQAIRRCGGFVVVQQPDDSGNPEMPLNALGNVGVNRVAPARELGKLLAQLVREHALMPPAVPEDLCVEALIAESAMTDEKLQTEFGTPISCSCPECAGPLREQGTAGISRYRCHAGHAFSSDGLLEGQLGAAERALWSALRILEERAIVLKSLARKARKDKRQNMSRSYEERSLEAMAHARALRHLLLGRPKLESSTQTDLAKLTRPGSHPSRRWARKPSG
jgi:two-component system, chemotaxis family, protein-glutamate methylesterase/glutaminase